MKTWLFLQTLIFELLSFNFLLTPNLTGLNWLSYIGAHAVASASFTFACWLLLPSRYKLPISSSAAFLFGFSFLLPLFGILGILFAVLLGLYTPRKHNIITWVEHDPSLLPLRSDEITYNHYGSGALREILTNSSDSGRRLQAVRAINHLPRQQAIPLLQFALKDLSDDVRLLAYTSLEGIETQINESIASLKIQFDLKKQSVKAYEIAQQYWELCYLGLADSMLRSHYLEQAVLYLKQSNRLKQTASNNLLLGRIMLEQAKPKDAISYLTQALNGGLLKTQVFPYLAEATYSMGDYKSTKEYIAQLPDRKGDKLNQIKEYWL